MTVNIRLVGPASGDAVYPGVLWLASYDPEAYGGRGAVHMTDARERAAKFEDAAHALRVYRASPACHPIRETDGKPNRPLTAYTIEIVRDDVEPLPL